MQRGIFRGTVIRLHGDFSIQNILGSFELLPADTDIYTATP